ncbi:hypothetical protein [Membranihabitans maritimus]|uniref:hypothetical protein n=1 Tax=Membranihabitans maritimus TaxID=2904244 RepID=UPI001F3DD00A|nr:hypothetical protein [Membranihabitans maritimus]
MQRKSLITVLIVFKFCLLFGQVYSDKKTQHRFAQTYIGLNTQLIPSSGRIIFKNKKYNFPTNAIPRLNIGGLHFWGKWDFNMNIPLKSLADKSISQGAKIHFSSGADLSARYYPWPLLDKKFRPFVGLSFNTMQLSLENINIGKRVEGFITSSLLTGFSYSYKGWQVNTEWMFLPQNGRNFYSNLEQKHQYKLPDSYFSIGIVKPFDFTLSEEKPKLSGKTKAIEELLIKNGKLNSFSIGIAANGSYFFKSPPFSDELRSLPRHKGSFNMEYSLGYFLHKQRIHLGLTYRTYRSNSVSYNLEHVIRRRAISLEGFKFIWNYNGFVPFIGISLSSEKWATGLFLNDKQQGKTSRSNMFSPGLIFGWDISPSSIDTWVLRTNLRYYPYQKINDGVSDKIRVDQFEFNFIQFVFYPDRWWHVRKARRKIK